MPHQAISEHAVVADHVREIFRRLSHELRTPLTSIIGFAEMMLDDTPLTEETRAEFAEIIKEEGMRLRRLVDNCLSYSDLRQTEVTLDRSEINLVVLAKKAVGIILPQAFQKSITIYLGSEPEGVHAIVDGERIFQVLLNLLENAVKYTPERGHIDLSIKSTGRDVDIIVRDTGIGIPVAKLPHLFREFGSLEKHAPRGGGLGLGLAISKHLVELHGGVIEVESQENHGTTITVRLPRGVKRKAV